MDPDTKLTHLLHLGAQLLEDPSPPKVQAVLRDAQAAGCGPANLYLSALHLWPRDRPLPPDPRVLFPLDATNPDEPQPGKLGSQE